MEIKSKAEFFRRWEEGLLGNRIHLFRDPIEAYNSGHKEIGFRQLGRAGGGAWEKVPREECLRTAARWGRHGREFIMDACCPNELSTLIGEVCRTYKGLEGYMGLSQGLPMRPAMANGLLTHRTGAAVVHLFHHYMDPSSMDDVYALLDLHPDATVEFACFSVNVGVIPGRNTIIWEVRNY